MPSMSPPSHSSPSKTFNSPSLAAEVEAAIKRADTPTLKAETPTDTPTPTEEGETEALLVEVLENEASFRKSPFETKISATSMEVSMLNVVYVYYIIVKFELLQFIEFHNEGCHHFMSNVVS